MRRYPPRPAAIAAAFAVVGGVALVGCSSGADDGAATSTPQASVSPTSSETHAPAAGAVEVSPGGVTTGVGTPAESTEEEYFQACHAAKVWMDQQGGDPKTHIEPYLAMVQSSDSAGPGTYGTPWSQLALARQSAVIVAVQAAADQLCG